MTSVNVDATLRPARRRERIVDEYGNIYRDEESAIPPADKARLDGYLTAKAEAGEAVRLKAELKRLRKAEKRLRERSS